MSKRSDNGGERRRIWGRACFPPSFLVLGLAFVGLLIASSPNSLAVVPEDPVKWERLFESAPSGSWLEASDARLDDADPGRLIAIPGEGVLISTKFGSKADRNLLSVATFGDVELRLEFMLAKGSNAGVKLHGLYEVQLFDSHGVEKPDATHAGGIYPRAVRKPRYRHIDSGTPPLSNAAMPAGEWQSLAIRFRAPRYDDTGNKTRPAVFEEVRLNGVVVQRTTEVDYPTGAYWRRPEGPIGPVYLQGDHGPVAYRNVRVLPLAPHQADSGHNREDKLKPSR